LSILPTEAPAQQGSQATLRLGEVRAAGVRTSATESWSEFECQITNPTDVDRKARVLLFYPGKPEVQFGRDVWVPARSTITTWLLAGPPDLPDNAVSCEILAYVAEPTGEDERVFLPTRERGLISRSVLYRPRELSTAVLLDEDALAEIKHGDLPPSDSPSEEALRLVRTLRASAKLPEFVHEIRPGALPVNAEAFAGIEQFVLASNRIARDPAGMQTLRQWLEQGGRVWVMLDVVDEETLDALLGEILDFEVVGRLSLTSFDVQSASPARLAKATVQRHDRPVNFVRVLLPPDAQPEYTVNGWPAAFTRQVGRGKVLFTTLGPRGWYQGRTPRDAPSPYLNYPTLPIATPPLEAIGKELQPAAALDPMHVSSFRQLLSEEIGYSILSRGMVVPIFVAFLSADLLLVVVLRNRRRREVVGWMIPAAAASAAATFLVVGERSRGSANPAVAVVQLVDCDTGTDESAVRGLLAAYRPDSGPAPVGVTRGGFFDLDMEGIKGQTRRLLVVDLDAWHWDNLGLPAGVRLGTFHATVPTGTPLKATAHFGLEGLEGKVEAGRFVSLADAVIATPEGRNMAVQMDASGAFRADSADVLPRGQFLPGAVLSDRQQHRQEVFRELLEADGAKLLQGRTQFLAWAKPLDMSFTLGPEAKTTGNALVALPVLLARAAPGQRVTVPSPFVPYRQIAATGPMSRFTDESTQAANMHLRFQLPGEVLPLDVASARLTARIEAPSRQVTISGQGPGRRVELYRGDSPLDAIRLTITDAELLRLDEHGG
ncbi:MAG TPA: hypothetical protein VKE94_09180, partial [Gemmataceae bacterium]|nr:hypothetical protein [Gemmataceae bacterium]